MWRQTFSSADWIQTFCGEKGENLSPGSAIQCLFLQQDPAMSQRKKKKWNKHSWKWDLEQLRILKFKLFFFFFLGGRVYIVALLGKFAPSAWVCSADKCSRSYMCPLVLRYFSLRSTQSWPPTLWGISPLIMHRRAFLCGKLWLGPLFCSF